MQYTIIGRIVDEMFDNKGECIVGYYVIDDNGKCNFGAVSKIYQLYKEGKIKGAKSFNEDNGEIDFANTDNSLLPKYSMTLFSGIGASGNICSVSENDGAYILKDASGQTKRFTEQDIVKGVKSGTIRLNNATVSKGTLSINKSISILGVQTKNGEQVGYKVALPNGEIKTFSKEEVIEKLIKEQGFQLFNAKLDGSGNLIAKSGTLPTKALDGIVKAMGVYYTDTFYIVVNNNLKQVTLRGKYSGMLKNGKPDGKGEFATDCADYIISYIGEYVDGVKQGYCECRWTTIKADNLSYYYKGDIRANKFDGKGVLRCNATVSGDDRAVSVLKRGFGYYIFSGTFAGGKPLSGIYDINGKCYSYKRDLKANTFAFSRDDGAVIITGKNTDFADFAIVGEGKLIYKDKFTYVGHFGQRVVSGKGTLTFTDGAIVECNKWDFEGKSICDIEGYMSKKLDHCKITYKNGDVFDGSAIISFSRAERPDTYINGKMVYADGTMYNGKWIGNIPVNLRYRYKLEEPICNENGYLLGYRVKCPDGKIVRLKCDDICKLASNPNVWFEDELLSSCCYYDDVKKCYKIDDDLLANYISNIKGDTEFDLLLKWYAKNISNLSDQKLKILTTNLFKYLIVPDNTAKSSASYDFFVDGFEYSLDYLISSSIETVILPSKSKDRTYGIPVSNLKYSNAILETAQCAAISKDKSHDMLVAEFKDSYSGEVMLSKYSGANYLDVLYKEYKGMLLSCNGTSLNIISPDVVKDGVFEVPKGVEKVWLCGLANRGIEHLILPETVKELWVDIIVNYDLDSYYGEWLHLDLDSKGYKKCYGDSFDFGLFKSLKSITFKCSLMSIFAKYAKDIIKAIEHWNKGIKLYLQPDDYAKFKGISTIAHSVAETIK